MGIITWPAVYQPAVLLVNTLHFRVRNKEKKKDGAGCFLSFDQGKKFQCVDFWRTQGVVRSGILWSQTNEFI